MSRGRRARVGALALGALAVLAASPASAQDTDPRSAGPEQVARAIIAADNAGDLDGVLALYADEAELWPPGEPPVRGREAIRRRYEGILATTRLALRTRILRVRQAADWALVEGTVEGTATPAAGGAPQRVNDKYFMVLELREGLWKISRLMWSPDG